jgi:amino acid transporter
MCYIATCVDPTGSLMKADPDNGFYVLAALVGGQWFGVVCVVAIALALGIFTGLAAQTSISRILYVMGQSGALPSWLGQLDEKNRQPVHATLFVSAVSLVMLVPLLFMSMDTVVKVSNFGALSTYCILNVCVLAICWFGAKKKTKPMRHLVFPVLGAVITFAILCSLGIVPIVVGVIWAALGIGYYLFRTRVQHKTIDMS